MKMFTTPEQTSNLIGLGFEKPKGWITLDFDDATGDYSIGELIEMLPDFISFWDITDFIANKKVWNVGYVFSPTISRPELIDALYEIVAKLKEEGVI